MDEKLNRIRYHSEAYWDGDCLRGQVVKTDFSRGTAKVIWTTPNEYAKDDEETVHLVCKKWASFLEIEITQATDIETM